MQLFVDMTKKMKDKEKKPLSWVVVLFAAGVILLIVGSRFMSSTPGYGIFGSGGQNQIADSYSNMFTQRPVSNAGLNDHVRQLEERLEEILSLIDGAGQVRVMITASRGREIVVAQTTNMDSSVTEEEDSAGGTRSSETFREQGAYVLVRQPDGSEVPLILTELEPQIEGVAIVAEGGDDIVVRDALIRTTFTVLGIGAHKVHVATGNASNN